MLQDLCRQLSSPTDRGHVSRRGSNSPPANGSYEKDHPHCMKVISDAEEEIQQLRGDKARLATQVGRLNAQVQELQKQLSTATANEQSRAQESMQSFLQELFTDASSMIDKVCSRMNVSQFDKCLAGPGAGNVPLAGPNGQFALNDYTVASDDPFQGGVNDLADFSLYPTDH
ncbi:uncharacterized protein PFLUO_LOCUS5873 [Penicillium psychrofluorescens]|uniref:uncharacterized protein n=1 Tax=Penicillium psychrofluorescens TaxID=3158075 RepID=UPI003CCCC165